MRYTDNFFDRLTHFRQLLDEAECVLIGAGSGLSTAAGIDYGGADFRREFWQWIKRYGITDLYSSSFYPFETQEELWAYWAKHIWFARYRPGATPLYKSLFETIRNKDYFVITTNVDGQFEKAGFDTDKIFATQGDYAFFQPKGGNPKVLYNNKLWVEKVLPLIKDCRIPTEMIPHTPEGLDVAMNLRCDNTFVEDDHWHIQAQKYHQFVEKSKSKRLLLIELGVGFNTPTIIRFPFEQMAAQFTNTALVRFNRDQPQLMFSDVREFVAFTEDMARVFDVRNVNKY